MASSMEGSTGTGTVPQIVYGVTCNEETIEISYPGEQENQTVQPKTPKKATKN